MSVFVTITSQGQITVPAKFRRQLGLKKNQKVLASVQDNKLIIEPAVDLLSLYGSLSHLAKKNKGKPIDEIIQMEEEGVAEAVADDYRKKFLKQK
ncbi:MAG: hypothetical protein UV59_C0012G0085 [Candidatus Gottesmanbacteria bacterium GW2011_GWA1_43_11]|uniref:SpoVT-AbrB domain-containing protein n=1 Tax=Candidatus Gottesmanbacteria bacterium GW2011_GWA1_43_11 TaxID=1618436 RepID=A0A0G1CHK1_9BACT|nr:MAG: hypothetical protein UV59_C0012G0085 [Candidatus Gottesmanbacteria bacterium GW2011_GWA1_43_11]